MKGLFNFFCSSKKGKISSRPRKKNFFLVFFHFYSMSGLSCILWIAIGAVTAAINGLILPWRVIYAAQANSALSSLLIGNDSSASTPTVFDNEGSFEKVRWVGCLYAWLGAVSFVCNFSTVLIWETIGLKSVNKLRLTFFTQALRMDLKWHENQGKNNNLNARLADDVLKVRNNLGSKVSFLITTFVSLLNVVGVCLVLSWKLGIVILGGTCLIAACIVVAGKISTKLAAAEQEAQRELGFITHEVLTSIKIVKSFGCQSYEMARFARIAKIGRAIANKKFFATSAHSAISSILTYLIYSAGISYGGYIFSTSEIETGNFIAIFFCIGLGSFAFSSFLPLMADISDGISSCRNLLQLFDATPQVDQGGSEGIARDNLRGDVVFENVTFSYPSRNNLKVLANLNLTIPNGKTIAIVGPSGAGKSSIINLILRLYDPSSGQISIDRLNIKSLNVNALRKRMGVVMQEPVLFDGTIQENIALGHLNASLDDVQSAAKQAQAHEFIMSLPQGYQTFVGERGSKLSGGQKQRVAIARALVRNPDIILFDEATSALDNASEKLVQQSMESVCRGKTSVIVAHRLSTIRQADMIYVLDKGSVAECGDHDELINRKGLYYSLYEEQKSCEEHSSNTQAVIRNGSLRRTRETSVSVENTKGDETDADKVLSIQMARKTLTNILRLSKKWMASVAILLSISAGLIIPIFTFLIFTPFIIGVLTRSTPEFFYTISFNMLYFAVASGILIFLGMMANSHFMEIAVENLRLGMFRSAVEQDMHFYDDEDTSPMKVANCILEQPGQMREMGGLKAGNALNAFTCIFVSIIIAVTVFWQLGLVHLIITFLVFLSNYIQIRSRRSMQKETNKRESIASKLISTCFDNITAVYCFSLQNYMVTKYSDIISPQGSRELRQIMLYAASFGLSSSLMFFYMTIAFTIGCQWIFNGLATVENLYRESYALQFALGSVGVIILYCQELGRAQAAIEKATNLMNLKRRNHEGSEKQFEITGAIELKNVSFSYPNCSNQVLRGLNLSFEPGRTVGIVGRSGSGKSTIISLLQKFYFSTHGEITIGGKDIHSLNTDELRNKMGLVTQEPVLFNGSIRDNILYGIQSLGYSVTDGDIHHCCQQANIHDFITSLPQGYDTEVGPRGSRLSGGQRQRIAIARALIRDPKILLLDEATSALDTDSEKEVQKALNAASKGRTTIVVAHRLSTIQNADLIVVLNNGVVVEKGTHNDLINLRGAYYSMTRQ